jgi:hypothetical protein
MLVVRSSIITTSAQDGAGGGGKTVTTVVHCVDPMALETVPVYTTSPAELGALNVIGLVEDINSEAVTPCPVIINEVALAEKDQPICKGLFTRTGVDEFNKQVGGGAVGE